MTRHEWKPGPPSVRRLNEGWLRVREYGCVLLLPYKVRYSPDAMTLAVFRERAGGWERQGSAFLDLTLDHCEAPPAPRLPDDIGTKPDPNRTVRRLYQIARWPASA